MGVTVAGRRNLTIGRAGDDEVEDSAEGDAVAFGLSMTTKNGWR